MSRPLARRIGPLARSRDASVRFLLSRLRRVVESDDGQVRLPLEAVDHESQPLHRTDDRGGAKHRPGRTPSVDSQRRPHSAQHAIEPAFNIPIRKTARRASQHVPARGPADGPPPRGGRAKSHRFQ